MTSTTSTTSTQPTTAATRPPWYVAPLSGGARLGVLVGSALLFLVAAVTLVMSITGASGAATALRTGADVVGALGWFLIPLAICVFSGYGFITLYRRANNPAAFRPGYPPVPPTTAGAPFEVRFRRPSLGQDLDGTGSITFGAEALAVEGNLAPAGWLQILIILVVTIVPLVLLGIGLGVIPAFLLASFIGRKSFRQAVPYAALRDLTVKGCRVTFTIDGPRPLRAALHVSGVDGERLYRELHARFPLALGGWHP